MLKLPTTNEEAIVIFRNASHEWLGDFGEQIFSRVFAASDWHYVSLTKICEGGAPLARGRTSKLILPDLTVYRDGRSALVEVKAKTQSIIYRNKGQERHGIDQENYLHYLEIQRQSGKPCSIGIVELWREQEDYSLKWSGSLLFEKLSDLIDPRSENPESPPKVYWRRKQFKELDSGLTPMELFEIAIGRREQSHTFELNNILFPARQTALF